MDFEQYVHKHGKRWVVAQIVNGQYQAPQRPDVRKLTGCSTTFGSLSYVAGDAYSYTRKSRALAKARELFG